MTALDDQPARPGRLDIEALDRAAELGPLFLSDCEGRLEIWRESALQRVTRDEDGEITGYSTPACYSSTDLVAEWDLDTWDPGEDRYDDERRRAAAAIVTAVNSIPAMREAGENLGKANEHLTEVIREAIRASWAGGAAAGMAVLVNLTDDMPEVLDGLTDEVPR